MPTDTTLLRAKKDREALIHRQRLFGNNQDGNAMARDHGGSPIMEVTDVAVAGAAATNLLWMEEVELELRIVATVLGIFFLCWRGYMQWRSIRKDRKDHGDE